MIGMEHAGHRERLRQRYMKEGLAGFAPHEALELLLTYAIPRVNTNPLAHALIDRFGSLAAVLEAAPAELEQVSGIGRQASTLLGMMLPLLRMYEQEKLLPRRQLNNYRDLAAYCRTLFLGAGCEQFYLLSLDANLSLLATTLLAQGTPSEVRADPRMVMQQLMRHNAMGAVVAHNHPSGSLTPSQEDVEFTQRLYEILSSVGIRLYDHVLIAGGRDFSFSAHRLLDGRETAFLPEERDEPMAADRPQRRLPPRAKKK